MRLRTAQVRVVAASVALALAVGSAACSDEEPDGAAHRDDTTSTTTAPTYAPVFEPGECDPERVPQLREVDCGTLVVPENREVPDARQVRLPVAIVRATETPARDDPIVYFSGGPGYSGLDAAKTFDRLGLGLDRDVITFDQRGTGGSEPSLDCPEVDVATYELFETTDPPAAEEARLRAAFAACRSRLTNGGVDLSMFDTPTVAQDVEDLRVALDVDEWNIFGASYGTTVALEVLRQQPGTVRSAVLDSAYPTDVGPGSDLVANADRAFETLYAGCAASAACSAAHPDLRAEVREAVDLLDASPFALELEVEGRTLQGRFTGKDLVAGLFNAMYDTSLIPLIPTFVGEVAAGNVALLDQVAREGIAFLVTAAEAQSSSVDCADRQRLVDQDEVAAGVAAKPDYGVLAIVRPLPQLCPEWDVPSVDASFNELAPTEVPTLVFGNEYDPVTPPANSERTAKALGDAATYVFFRGLGHGAFHQPCPRSILEEFLAEPGNAPDTSCAASMTPPDFPGT